MEMYYAVVLIATLVVSSGASSVQYTLKPETQCGKLHTAGDDNLVIDSISLIQTDENNRIAAQTTAPFACQSFSKACSGSFEMKTSGSNKNNIYHIILHVRLLRLTKETGYWYYYFPEGNMFWNGGNGRKASKWDKSKSFDNKLYNKNPFLIGEVTVTVDGKTVISRKAKQERCFDSYSWIADHGIYLLKDDKWKTMYYYPREVPQILSHYVPMMTLFRCVILLSTLNGARMLSCYHCISQLPLEGVEDDARLALKQLVFQRYNVPPSHEYCDDSKAYDFLSAETQTCDDTDQCIKISIFQKELSFVMRGCRSKLLRSSYYLSKDAQCTNSGASQCLCDENLCNISGNAHTILIYIICIAFMLIV
ncbi:unnamed protein product [Cylicocyclus nassatus]|uniref:Uncharacterized protein n=1 Tax=Cylicocyclus nassatus TaxID=53992 RepID=A0AA36ME13_CYLNA|nr:unnamed protein product [Cylicocyclus nassatus]